jgi:hypothetical protein
MPGSEQVDFSELELEAGPLIDQAGCVDEYRTSSGSNGFIHQLFGPDEDLEKMSERGH